METDVGPLESVSGLTLNSGDLLKLQGSSGLGGYAAAAHATIVNAGGQVQAYIGALYDTTINAGGQVSVTGSHSYVTDTIVGGRLQVTDPSAQVVNTTVGSGGTFLLDAGSVDHTTVNAGGVLVFTAYPSTQIATNTVVASGGAVRFEGSYSGGARQTQLLAGGHIDLVNLAFGAGLTTTFDAATDTLTVTGATSYTLDLAGDYNPSGFTLVADGTGGTLVSATPLCFGKGTRILTPGGEVPVERLAVGDAVITARGRSRRIVWTGSATFIVGGANRPVIVRRGALPGGMPSRDLRLTAGHSLLFGDVLIPAGDVVNGSSIVWDDARLATVFHFELEAHDVVFADGALAESFRDDGNRHSFAAGGGTGRAARATPTCAPVVRTGPVVERTRRRLEAWAALHPHLFRAGDDAAEKQSAQTGAAPSSSHCASAKSSLRT